MSLPHATVFSDASYCHITKAAGWGAWMISRSKPSATGGGPVRGPIIGTTQAELVAMANALHIASRRGYLIKGAEVMLQSDCLGMLGWLRHQFKAEDRPMKDPAEGIPAPPVDPKCWSKRHNGTVRKAADPMLQIRRQGLVAIRDIIDEWQLRLIVRHVRGHRNKAAADGDGRAFVNKECDRIARLGMIKARLQLTAAKREQGGEGE